MPMNRFPTPAVHSTGSDAWLQTARDELLEIAWLLSVTATLSLVGVGLAVALALSL